MQHALLALAIALILAIAAALAAPAYMDWNDWRATFEDRATALVGTPVRIRGRIDATLLPTPAFVLRDVEAGDPDKATGIRVGEVRGILSLGALLRGMLEAEEFVLVRPAVRLAIDDGDRPLLPALRAAAGATGFITLARLTVERGSLIVDDRAAGRQTVFDEISADGEVRARQGPMRIDATFQNDGRRWSLRTSAGGFNDAGVGRVRLTLEQAGGGGMMFDADGMLTLSGAAPHFDGKLVAARRDIGGKPWQATANAKASEAAVALDGFALTLGADAAPTELAGQIQFTPRRGGRIDGTLSARRLDLDTAAGAEGPKRLSEAFETVREIGGLAAALPFQGRVAVAADAIMAGGGLVRALKADLGLRQGSLVLERLDAVLPGRGSIKTTGVSSGGGLFAADAVVEAEDASALARWLFGEAVPGLRGGDAVRASGKVKWAGGRMEVDDLDFAMDEAKLGGRFAVTPGNATRRMRIETNLTASNIDLDLLAPAANALGAGLATTDLVLHLRGSELRFLKRPIRQLDASVSRTQQGAMIERLVVEDFDGLSLRTYGLVVAPLERPGGSIDFELQTTRPDGLAALATELLGADAGLLVRRIVTPDRPLKLSGKASGAGSAAGVEVSAVGQLADIATNVEAHFDLLTQTLSEAQVTLTAAEAGKLVALFGLPPGPSSRGEGTLEVNFASAGGGGVLPVMARLSVPDARLSAEGELRANSDGRIEPRLNLRLLATDLRPMLAGASPVGGEAAIPGDGTARLVRTPDAFALENVVLNVGGTRVQGALAARLLETPTVSGKLSLERMAIADLLALVVGSTREGGGDGSFWPVTRLEPAPLAGLTGAVELEVDALAFADRHTATATKFRLRLGANDAAIEDFTGDFAGGKLAGHARFIRGDTLAFDGRASLADFDLGKLLVSAGGKADMRGRGGLTISIAGNGRTPAALVSGLSGQGTITLQGLEVDRVDPDAVAAVFHAGEKNEPRDEIAVLAALAPALAEGSLHIAKLEAPVIVAGGVARTAKARTSTETVQVAAEAAVDIARLTVDAAIELEIAPPPGMTVRPGATVRWRGPLAAPERGIEAAALATAMTLRAVERETKRIEERDRALPPRSESSPAASETNPIAAFPAPAGKPDTPAVPNVAPPAVRAPAAPSRPRVIESPPRVTDTPLRLPPLAPPIDIRPAPQIFAPPPAFPPRQ